MLFNHVPIIGLAVAFVVLAAGVALHQTFSVGLGLVLITVTAGFSIPVARFGDDAYPAVFETLNGDGRAWLDYHVLLADRWIKVLYANTALALIAMGLGGLRPPWLRPAAIVVLIVTLGGIASAVLIAHAGGKIKHPEFRLEDPPETDGAGRLS